MDQDQYHTGITVILNNLNVKENKNSIYNSEGKKCHLQSQNLVEMFPE